METVIDALKVMGKASYREIAVRLKVEPVEALNMLREHRESGICDFTDGGWHLTKDVDSKQTIAADKTALVKKITERTLIDAIRQHGPQTAGELASLFGVTSRKVASTLAMATKKSRVHRVAKDGKYCYCLPNQHVTEMPESQMGSKPERQPEAVKLSAPEITSRALHDDVAEVMRSIPSFAEKRPDDMIFPSLHMANRELRRAKSQVQKWERVCAALRELNKHRDIVRKITKAEGKAEGAAQ
ncbi:DUF1627 domain-containing protein [Salmonella enterica subsp. enterica]|nr:DUF1627 domain-containing protein [Salmonella enterica subsp. enterica]